MVSQLPCMSYLLGDNQHDISLECSASSEELQLSSASDLPAVWASLGSLSHLLPSYRGGEEKCNIQEQMWEPSMRKGQSIMNSVIDVVSWIWYFSSNHDSNMKLFNINAVFKIFHLWRCVLPQVSRHLKILPIDSDLRAVKKKNKAIRCPFNFFSSLQSFLKKKKKNCSLPVCKMRVLNR